MCVELNPCYAIVPAAGSSRRMGQPKLLMSWKVAKQDNWATPEMLVIDRVLEAWTTSRVTEVVVIVRPEDAALKEACQRWPVTVVHPTAPTLDMKASVCVGLRALHDRNPPANARCFIAPADLPGLTSHVIDRILESSSDAETIVLPRFGGSLETSTLGHPALLPWRLTHEIFELPADAGIDSMLQRHRHAYVLFPAEMSFKDIDTPEDYRRELSGNGFT
jgi:molybdenum cofactor cytidylyltransferase